MERRNTKFWSRARDIDDACGWPWYWFDALRRAHRTGHLSIVDDVRRPVLGVALAVDPVALRLDGGHSSPQRKERVDLAVGCCEVLVQLDERVQLAQRPQVQKRRHWVVLVDVLPPRGRGVTSGRGVGERAGAVVGNGGASGVSHGAP